MARLHSLCSWATGLAIVTLGIAGIVLPWALPRMPWLYSVGLDGDSAPKALITAVVAAIAWAVWRYAWKIASLSSSDNRGSGSRLSLEDVMVPTFLPASSSLKRKMAIVLAVLFALRFAVAFISWALT